MIKPVTIQNDTIRLEPLTAIHVDDLAILVTDGNLWELNVTSAPKPEDSAAYIEKAIHEPGRQPFAVIEQATNQFIGTTSYHDILPQVKRLEIGYTFYGQSYWRSYVNTTCKLLLLTHAFETLRWQTVGWRTDNLNSRSQKAIERLGAKKDGIIRGQAMRKDGTIRDTVMYSMTAKEWPDAKKKLLASSKGKLD